MPDTHFPEPHRDIFCNRTLNLRSIQAIGYDMDYTLIQYRQEAWELRSYEHLRQKLLAKKWPVEHLTFNPEIIERGLVLDLEKGNILKPNRFGYIKQAYHGTQPLDFNTQRQEYSRIVVTLSEPRFVFLNTLFSLSEGCMWAQLVDIVDASGQPRAMGYQDLYVEIKRNLDAAHMEGELKAEIIADPKRFVELDEETPLALLDQMKAQKRLMLITNSDWPYTQAMMSYAFDRFLPSGMTWKDLFEIVIVSARKPDFFSSNNPIFEVLDEQGMLKPVFGELKSGGVFFGGNASCIEQYLGLSGDELLYVGDHLFTDVHITKAVMRWRTALILRELEDEIKGSQAFRSQQETLESKMLEKRRMEFESCKLRLELQRLSQGYRKKTGAQAKEIHTELDRLRQNLEQLDTELAPLAEASAKVGHPIWGPMMRAGNDKSLLAWQVERYADIYTSRPSNFLFQTPFVYLRSPRGSLPHDL